MNLASLTSPAYVYRSASVKSREAQDDIHASVVAVTKSRGWKDRGQKTAGFYVIKNTRMPALLTENGFIDTGSNADDLKQASFIQALGVAHAKGIAAAFGLRRKVTTPPPEQEIESIYDMSYLKGNELEGRRSTRHPEEFLPHLEWAMRAHAQCVLILRRDFDLRNLQNALNKMFPDNK
ncbi:N-acetylmuramoyl-L-alanine amidase [Lihuaxuella thermophila]|uniref:N-acetylmuramoyl-L-alanine amidase n=2 Tax=Lihuaxuella thermophila TaxID=1173111 RepID=A0A1H8AUX0_9BACL|nr:N-acetylmuramoyl-L-alanine amidase [Lihuaxuella thermophila]